MRTRSRTRTRTGSWTSTGRYPDGSAAWFHESYPSYTEVVSSITDVVNSRGTFNDVIHGRSNIDFSTVTLPKTIRIDGSVTAEIVTEWDFHAGDLPSGSIDFTDPLRDLISDAIGTMPQKVALVVNVAELSSLKSLVPSLLSGFKALRKQKWSRKTLKELAGSHLAYSFGLAPLVADFKAFRTIRADVAKRVRELENRNGKSIRLTKRGSGSDTAEFDAVFHGGDYDLNCNTQWSCTTVNTVSCDVASFFVNDNESQAHLWADALGLSSPLTNAWELVPFSFVIDWFVPIGETFRHLESKLGLHESVRSVHMSNFGHSTKVTGTFSSELVAKSYYYPGWNNLRLSGSNGRQTRYVRSSGIPATSLISGPSGWSISRTALSISLILQKGIK